MKIKIINPDMNPEINESMMKSARKVIAEGTEVVCVCPPAGPRSIDDGFTKDVAVYHILEEILLSEKEGGYDGYVLACFGDPGRQAAREITDKPVVGLGEASLAFAGMISDQYSIITIGSWIRWIYRELIARCGVEHKVASMRSLSIASEESHSNPDSVYEKVLEAAKAAIKQDYAEAILLGCGVMAPFAEPLQKELGIPVIDPVAAGVKMAETLVYMNLKNSKAYSYQAPQSPQLINVEGVLNELYKG